MKLPRVIVALIMLLGLGLLATAVALQTKAPSKPKRHKRAAVKPRPQAKPKPKEKPAMELLKITQWGGNGIRVGLEEDAQPASFAVSFDCAHGVIQHPVELDSSGNFAAPGTYTPEHGGPVRIDEPDLTEPVRYTGQVKDGQMTLRIVFDKSGKTLGPYQLRANSQGRIFKCL